MNIGPEALASLIQSWSQGASRIDIRRDEGAALLLYAEPRAAGAASLEVILSPEYAVLQLFVANVLNAEYSHDDHDEAFTLMRAVVLFGCRVRRIGWRNVFEAGPPIDDAPVVREWAPWVSGHTGDVATMRERIQR